MKFTNRDLTFLIENLVVGQRVMDQLHQARARGPSDKAADWDTSIYFSEQDLREIETSLGDLLCERGITDGEINGTGRYLEDLLDAVLSELD